MWCVSALAIREHRSGIVCLTWESVERNNEKFLSEFPLREFATKDIIFLVQAFHQISCIGTLLSFMGPVIISLSGSVIY